MKRGTVHLRAAPLSISFKKGKSRFAVLSNLKILPQRHKDSKKYLYEKDKEKFEREFYEEKMINHFFCKTIHINPLCLSVLVADE